MLGFFIMFQQACFDQLPKKNVNIIQQNKIFLSKW